MYRRLPLRTYIRMDYKEETRDTMKMNRRNIKVNANGRHTEK